MAVFFHPADCNYLIMIITILINKSLIIFDLERSFTGSFPKGGRLAGSFFLATLICQGVGLLFKLIFRDILYSGNTVVGLYYISF